MKTGALGERIERLKKMATTNVADALDKVGVRGAVIGIRPMFECPKIAGKAVTIKITAAGMVKSKHHLGIQAIHAAEPGDVVVIDNSWRWTGNTRMRL
jgi:4-hydroxy-4-methyl-2-oxoglutarate aldolase